MLWVCVISHNQNKWITPMLEALSGFPNKLFVLDKCRDGSRELLKRSQIPYIETECSGHGAAFARNAGAVSILETFPDADILFLDGDRVPHNVTFAKVKEGLEKFDEILIMCMEDIRKYQDLTREGVFKPYDFDIRKKHVGFDSKYNLWNAFYTCGFAMRNEAMLEVMSVCDGNLFAANLMGTYGYEDNVLGIECKMLGHKMAFMPSQCFLEGWVGNDKKHDKTEVYQREKANYALDCFANIIGYQR